ncbi:MAG: pre-16S rRNA-processing nuclease YqgF [Hungatella sp.]|nr:pre-16S rRNA-processing nuclease YqgF [Hungatella sp.]
MFGSVILFCFQVVMPQYSGGYNGALVDKVERLKSIRGAKMVLIGNSNVSFGMDSRKLEQAFGMPVVNMGLHGGLKNVFHEEMARLNVCEGDIYIICHTSFSDENLLGDKALVWNTIENHFELWPLLRSQDIWPMMEAYPVYLKKCLELFVSGRGNGLPGGCYSRDAFNEYGDVALERNTSEYTFESPVPAPAINDTVIDRINELSEWLSERGATLLVAGYPIGKGELTAPEEEFVKAKEELTKRLSCPVISDYRDYMFDYNLFYNTDLHLTTEGAALRTQQLIEDLQQWMGQDADP